MADKKYTYYGPMSAVTLAADADHPNGRNVQLMRGLVVSLPEDNAYVASLVARKYLVPVEDKSTSTTTAATAATAKTATTASTASQAAATETTSGTAASTTASQTTASTAAASTAKTSTTGGETTTGA